MNDDTDVMDQTADPTIVEDPKDMLRQARELIPVGSHGAGPVNRAQQVDYAQDMAKAQLLIPKFLRNNVGDCLGIVEIATAANLVPYLLARQCYLEPGSGQIALMAQAYHALVVNHLKGDLEYEFDGVGDDRICIVIGYLRHSPEKPRVHRSPPLKQVHPGHTTKDGKKYVRGSPLWDRKPDVQLIYDTSRDWVRIYCPRATMGFYTGEELREYGPEFARDVTPPGVAKRLEESGHGREEGPQGHEKVEAELAGAKEPDKTKRKPGRPRKTAESHPTQEATPPPPPADDAPPPTADAAPAKPEGNPPPPAETQSEAQAAIAAKYDAQFGEPDSKIGSAPQVKQADPAPQPEPEKKVELPKTPEQWKAYCLGWLKDLTSEAEIRQRWNQERGLRNACGLLEAQRTPVMLVMQQRCDELTKG